MVLKTISDHLGEAENERIENTQEVTLPKNKLV